MRTLTNRYVHAVVRRVPEAMRPEVTADVTAMIADMIEARQDEMAAAEAPGAEVPGADRDAAIAARSTAGVGAAAAAEVAGANGAEVAVLEELGDPAVLAREYSDAPQHLIGPAYYHLYLWTLKWVMPLTLVVGLVANGLTYAFTTRDAHLGGLLGTSIGETVPGLFIAFGALTIIFAIIERATPLSPPTGAGASTGAAASGTDSTASGAGPAGPRSRWTVDRLEDIAPGGTSVRADAIVSLVFIVLLALVPFLPTTALYVGHLNDGEPFVNPELGIVWFVGYWVLLAVMAVGAAWRIRRRRLSTGPVALDMVSDLAMAVFLTIALLTRDVLHPALDTASALPVALWAIPLIWAITICDQVSTVRAYRTHLAAQQRS